MNEPLLVVTSPDFASSLEGKQVLLIGGDVTHFKDMIEGIAAIAGCVSHVYVQDLSSKSELVRTIALTSLCDVVIIDTCGKYREESLALLANIGDIECGVIVNDLNSVASEAIRGNQNIWVVDSHTAILDRMF